MVQKCTGKSNKEKRKVSCKEKVKGFPKREKQFVGGITILRCRRKMQKTACFELKAGKKWLNSQANIVKSRQDIPSERLNRLPRTIGKTSARPQNRLLKSWVPR